MSSTVSFGAKQGLHHLHPAANVAEAAVAREIEPATLNIGKDRKSGSDELLLP